MKMQEVVKIARKMDVPYRVGLSKAELIRIAVDEFLKKTEQTGEIVQRHFVNRQNVSGKNNNATQVFSHAPGAPATGASGKPKGKRGKKPEQ